jgi:hypothetical protein
MVASVPFLERLMPGIALPGAVRPALPPRFAPGQPAEVVAEAFPFEPRGEHSVVEGEKLTVLRERRSEDASPVRTPQSDDSEQSSGSALSPAISPILAAHAAGQPESPALAVATTHPPGPAAAASVFQGQSVYHQQQGGNPREHPDAPAVLSGTPTATVSGNLRPPLPKPVIEERATNPVRTEIHVTIDRIDVRAPAAAPNAMPQAAPRSRPASTLSLSDYLRQRGRGAR